MSGLASMRGFTLMSRSWRTPATCKEADPWREGSTIVGLDVHKDSIGVPIAVEGRTGEVLSSARPRFDLLMR